MDTDQDKKELQEPELSSSLDEATQKPDNPNQDTPHPTPAAADPGKTLGIISLITSIVGFGVAGIVLGIIGRVKSKKAGHKNGLALAGIIVGIVMTIASLIIAVTLVAPKLKVAEKCIDSSSDTVFVDGKFYSCKSVSGLRDLINYESTKEALGKTNIKDTPVTLVGNTVESACFTFKMPSQYEYEINPESIECKAAIRLKGGDSLSQINIQAQVGEDTVESALDKAEEAAKQAGKHDSFKGERVSINGQEAAVVYVEGGAYQLLQALYFIPDNNRAFALDTRNITSYIINGPAYNSALKDVIDEVAQSFKIK